MALVGIHSPRFPPNLGLISCFPLHVFSGVFVTVAYSNTTNVKDKTLIFPQSIVFQGRDQIRVKERRKPSAPPKNAM